MEQRVELKLLRESEVSKRQQLIAGLIIILTPVDNNSYEGDLQIIGIDAIGNEFKAHSQKLLVENSELKNQSKVDKTYLQNV